LQGRASGVDIIRADGAPGSEPSIRIRGTGTLNNSDPLVVIELPVGRETDPSVLNTIAAALTGAAK